MAGPEHNVLHGPSLAVFDDSPKPRDADAPFNDKNADIILRTCDLVDFHVYKLILSLASPVFKDIFTLPSDESVPVVDLTEDSHTIDFILRCCYPANAPTLTEVKEIKHVLWASQVQIQPVTDIAETALEDCIEQDPLGVFAVACQMEFPEICREAAKETLQHSLAELDSPELPLASTIQFRKLVQYHLRCCAASSATISSRGCISQNCCGIPIQNNRGHSQTLGLNSTCLACAYDYDSGWWGPSQLWRYLHHVERTLQIRPHRSAALSSENVAMWAPYVLSSCGGQKFSHHSFIESLATQIDAAVAKVEIPEFC